MVSATNFIIFGYTLTAFTSITAYFEGQKYEFKPEEREYFKEVKGDYGMSNNDDSMVASFKRDNRFCMTKLENPIISNNERYFSDNDAFTWYTNIQFLTPMRITAIHLINSDGPPSNENNVRAVHIKYRIYKTDLYEMNYEGKKQKMYKLMEFEGRDEYFGYGTILINPNIYAIELQLSIKVGYIIKYKMYRMNVYGCYDDIMLKDLQFADLGDKLNNYKVDGPKNDRKWLVKLKPDYEADCSIFENGAKFNKTGKCENYCRRALGMQSGYIPNKNFKTSIRSRNINTGYEPFNARLKQVSKDPKYFEFTFQDETVWLQITLVFPSVIDGWATNCPQKNDCFLKYYYVMYAAEPATWRYVSKREWIEKESMQRDRRIQYEHVKGEITRYWLNPRVSAKQIRFLFIRSDNEQSTVCIQAEIYGCPKYSLDENDRLIKQENYLTGAEKAEAVKEEYEFDVMNIGKDDIEFNKDVLMYCCKLFSPIYFMAKKFVWTERIYNSVIMINATGKFSLFLPIKANFYKRYIKCEIMYDDVTVLFTKDFLLIEKQLDSIVPFVTATPDIEYNGGHLIKSEPAEFFIEGNNLMFFKIHLANIVYPLPRVIPNSRYCVRKEFAQKPYFGYKEYRTYENIDQNRCIREAIKGGSRTLSYTKENKKCLGGPALNGWVQTYIEENCKPVDWVLDDNIRHFTTSVFRLHYMTDVERLELYVYADDTLVYYKDYKTSVGLRGQGDLWTSFIPTRYWMDVGWAKSSDTAERSVYQQLNNNGMLYHDCKTSKANQKNPLCASDFSIHGSKNFGTGYFLTFTFAFRNKIVYDKSNIRVEGIYQYRNQRTPPKKFIQYIDIRQKGEPKIKLNEQIGICNNQKKEIQPVVKLNSVFFNGHNMIKYDWKKYHPESKTQKESLTDIPLKYSSVYKKGSKLIFPRATKGIDGLYQFMVDSPLGAAIAITNITVMNVYPQITWQSVSPHVVVEGDSDIIEIKTNINEHIEAINWYKNNELIKCPHNNYAFADYNGKEHQKKRLLIKNIKGQSLGGKYRVELIGKYCSSSTEIDTIINEKPYVTFSDKEKYLIFKTSQSKTLKVSINGGNPKVKLRGMTWYKDNLQIANVKGGRIYYEFHINSEDSWTSFLYLTNIHLTDQGVYSFNAIAGKANVTVSKKVFVDIANKITDGKSPQQTNGTDGKVEEKGDKSKTKSFTTKTKPKVALILLLITICICLIKR